MKFVVLFPGQGSQKRGMGVDLYQMFDMAKDFYSKVDKIAGREISKITFYGTDEELNQTKNTQIAVFAFSVLLTEILKQELSKQNLPFAPVACCGHSLGEFTALWFANVLPLEDLIRLVCLRGELMQNAPQGAMAAVLNYSYEDLKRFILKEGLSHEVVIANHNSPVQYVISGSKEAINLILPRLKSLGVKAILLPVSGAFHSPLMQGPAEIFSREVNKLNLADSTLLVFQNTDALPGTKANEIKEKIKQQMISPVYWTQTINNLSQKGITTVIEIGPGKVLTGLVKKINPDIECHNISDYNLLLEFVRQYKTMLTVT